MSEVQEALTSVLNPARHVLLDFDGPVCSIFASISASDVACQLREELWRGSLLPGPRTSLIRFLSFAVSKRKFRI